MSYPEPPFNIPASHHLAHADRGLWPIRVLHSSSRQTPAMSGHYASINSLARRIDKVGGVAVPGHPYLLVNVALVAMHGVVLLRRYETPVWELVFRTPDSRTPHPG